MNTGIAPITVIADRYDGIYIGLHMGQNGKFIAWHREKDQVPSAPFQDDAAASAFWAWAKEMDLVVGIGHSEETAKADLVRKIRLKKNYDAAKQPRYLGNWRP
jgi:poly-gamma-glutamate capsule biosynthesis protein CapA/YwtB (metallophosphatase superfamily)